MGYAVNLPQAITVAKAARGLDMDSRTLRRQLREAGIRVWMVGGRFKVDAADFDRWVIAQRTRRGTPMDSAAIKAEADRLLFERRAQRLQGI